MNAKNDPLEKMIALIDKSHICVENNMFRFYR